MCIIIVQYSGYNIYEFMLCFSAEEYIYMKICTFEKMRIALFVLRIVKMIACSVSYVIIELPSQYLILKLCPKYGVHKNRLESKHIKIILVFFLVLYRKKVFFFGWSIIICLKFLIEIDIIGALNR